MKKALILVADYYQELEVWYPLLRLREENWQVTAVGTENKKQYLSKVGYPIDVDGNVSEMNPTDFDCVIIPGGWAPDIIRRNHNANQLVADMFKAGKTVAAICHGGWVLISANVVRNRQCTSFFSIKDDMINAGGKWIDAEVVVDKNLVTSRKPDDLPAFCRAILDNQR